MEDLKKLTLTELKGALESVNKAIKAEEEFLGKGKDSFLKDGELWTIRSTKLIKVKDLLNEKTGKPIYDENRLKRLIKGIDDLRILNKRRNNIIIEIKRREWGDEFFDRESMTSTKNKNIVQKEDAELEELKNKILKLRTEIKGLIIWRKELKLDIEALQKENEILENQFDNDIDDFPTDLAEKLESKKQAIIKKQNEIEEIETKLWGFLGAEKEGMIWQHDRMVEDYKKKKVNNNELYEKLRNKSIEKKNEEIQRVVKNILDENKISSTEEELNELVLDILAVQLSDLEQFYEDVINDEKDENRLVEVANKVLESKYDIPKKEAEVKRIKFATPRANRDARIQELNKIIGKLEYEKMMQRDNEEAVKIIESQLKSLEEEYKELSSSLIGDFLLGNDIKDSVRKIIEETKNETGLTYLDEVEYDKTKNTLIEECSRKIFNKVTNNEYEEKLSKDELNKFINDEIILLLPELDKRFLIIRGKKLVEKTEVFESNERLKESASIPGEDYEQYIEYGRECYIKSWKDAREHYLGFSEMMKEKYGEKINRYIIPLWKFIGEHTNPITFIGCDKNLLEKKIAGKNKTDIRIIVNDEIKRVQNYVKEIEKLLFLTSSQSFIKDVEEITLEKYPEWQVYFIEKIKYDELREFIDHLRKNRPTYSIGHDDYEYYSFDIVPRFALDEFKKYLNKLEKIMDNNKPSQIETYNQLWNNTVNSNFNTEMIIMALDYVGDENENEFIKYMKRMYGRRTREEWMKYYEMEDKIGQYQKLKAQNLPPEIESQNNLRIANAKYDESTVGQHTLQNLRSFEEKFIKENRGDKKYEETEINLDLKKKWEFKKAIEKVLDGLTIADTLEEKIYKDIEYWEEFSKVRYRGPDDTWVGESWSIAVSMLQTYILNDLKQAKITGYYKGNKIDVEAAERLHKFVKGVIDSIEDNNITKDADELDEENVEEFRIINKGKNIDVVLDGSELPTEDNEKQRDKIKQFLLENYNDFDTNLLLNVNRIAYEFTDFYYPKLTKQERKKKKESIRQELLLFRNGKIPLK